MSRFENVPDRKELLRMTKRWRTVLLNDSPAICMVRARRITIDLDPTDDHARPATVTFS